MANDPSSSSEALAAATCYLLSADPTMLDPDGDLGAQLWPLDIEDFEPSNTPKGNIEKAIAMVALAVEFLQIEEDEQ